MSGNMGKNPEPWELDRGDNVIDRTRKVAQVVREYRDTIGLNINQETQNSHNSYIHETGASMLKIQLPEVKVKRSNSKIQKIMKRAVKVSEMDDGGLTIALDLEWDTSSWGNDEIEAGCEALLSIFQAEVNPVRRAQAVRMLSKLLERHKCAVNYMRQSIQPIIHKCVSQRVRVGRSVAALNLIFVLHCSIHIFYSEISSFNFTEHYLDMLLVEAKLAATLIQHTFRTFKEGKSIKFNTIGKLAKGFGTPAEIMRSRKSSINARSAELRKNWKLLHMFQTKNERRGLYGARGPVHIMEIYTVTGLQVLEYLMSNKSKESSQANREDLLHSGGLILLVGFLSAIEGPFSFLALSIILHVSLDATSLIPMIRSGVVTACLKYIKYYRRPNAPKNGHIDRAIATIGRLARHAAGIYRAKNGYSDIVIQNYGLDTVPSEIDYNFILAEYNKNGGENLLKSIGNKKLVHEISNIIIHSTDINYINHSIQTLLFISSSECYTTVLEVLVEYGAILLSKLVSFLDCNGEELCLANSSLALIVQLTCHHSPRSGMLLSKVVIMMKQFIDGKGLHDKIDYQRCAMILTCLCRVGEIRSYDPDALLELLGRKNIITSLVLMDFMVTIKQTPQGDKFTFPEIVILPSNEKSEIELSEIVIDVSAPYICKFLVNPEDDSHYANLSWEMSSCACCIIAAFASREETAETILLPSTIKFLGQVFNLGYLEISQKNLSHKMATLMLSGIDAAVDGLSKFSTAVKKYPNKASALIEGIEDSNAIIAANYFLLSLANSKAAILPPSLLKLQESVALKCCQCLTIYSNAICNSKGQSNEHGLHFLANNVGSSLVQVLQSLLPIYGQTPKMIRILDNICQLLANITSVPGGVSLALKYWNLLDHMKSFLPPPLSKVGDFMSETLAYKHHLRELPAAFFQTVANLGTMNLGAAIAFSEGFLRRALDKVGLMASHLETEQELRIQNQLIKEGKIKFEVNMDRVNIASCLAVVARCANYHSPKFGSANDMIFHPKFEIISLCAGIISTEECARTDPAFLSAIKVLRYVAKDASNVYDLFKQHNVLQLIHRELKKVGNELPYDATVDCIDAIFNIAMGMRGKYLREYLPKVCDSLTRASRIHIALAPAVAETLWAITKNQDSSQVPIALQQNDEFEGGVHSDEIQELLKLASEEEKSKYHTKPGTYEACGVSSCGSLKYGVTSDCHGEIAKCDHDKDIMIQSLHLDRLKPNELELSKLSAREKKLRDEVDRRKDYFNFTDETVKSIKLSASSTGVRKSPNSKDTLPTSNDEQSDIDLLSGSLSLSVATPNTPMTEFKKNKILSTTSPAKPSNYLLAQTRQLWSPVRTDKANKVIQCGVIKTVDVLELPELLATRPPPRSRGLSSSKK